MNVDKRRFGSDVVICVYPANLRPISDFEHHEKTIDFNPYHYFALDGLHRTRAFDDAKYAPNCAADGDG